MIYVEEHALSSKMRSGEAIISATAIESNMTLESCERTAIKGFQTMTYKTKVTFGSAELSDCSSSVR